MTQRINDKHPADYVGVRAKAVLSEILLMQAGLVSGALLFEVGKGELQKKNYEPAIKNLRAAIDIENSVHKASYHKHLKMLDSGGTSSRVKLEPKAVCDKLIWALESPWPKAHYYITFPTHLLATFRRILPQRMLDRFLIFASGKE